MDKEVTEYTFKNLVPTKRYVTGVLAIDDANGTILYGESNTRTGACQIKVPTLSFNEWTNIISLGPKTDSRLEIKYNLNSESGDYDVKKPTFQRGLMRILFLLKSQKR